MTIEVDQQIQEIHQRLVAHLPTLRKVCHGDYFHAASGKETHEFCGCHGTGRVLADGVNGGTVIVAIKDTLPVTDIVWKVKEGMWWVRLYNTQGEQVGEAESEDLDQTIYEASVQALEAEQIEQKIQEITKAKGGDKP